MRGTFRRRGALVAAVAALSAGGLLVGTVGSASATASIPLSTTFSVGVYRHHSVASGKVGVPDLAPGDSVIAVCWDRGDNLGIGNVWYRVIGERYSGNGVELFIAGWTYGGHVDGNVAFHTGAVPIC
ncbi:hypothetical protein [Streptomyces sp. LN704]|uniref:hypothetical protein n=1 Tax=Streptomyces sp. LN704 TaxID=3112982 RepID=UPI0037176C7E